MSPLGLRRYGDSGPEVVLIHGGPGAAGSMRSLARSLEGCRVYEPLQRRAEPNAAPLTVRDHVEDHAALLATLDRPVVIGSSWGAMLALCVAAAAPETVDRLILIGCGTFDAASRDAYRATIESRTTPAMASTLDAARRLPNADRAMLESARAMLPAYVVEPTEDPLAHCEVDAQGHRETWDDMIARQNDGTYPQRFENIRCPVLMVHGDQDPHPGPSIRDSLIPHVPHLVYVELERCGHYPWLERHARAEFFNQLRQAM